MVLVVQQCSKLKFGFVHLPDAKVVMKVVHLAICSFVTQYIILSKIWENHVHSGCPGLKNQKSLQTVTWNALL